MGGTELSCRGDKASGRPCCGVTVGYSDGGSAAPIDVPTRRNGAGREVHWRKLLDSVMVWLVVLFALVLIAFGSVGAVGSIIADWRLHGAPFGCDVPS